MKIAIAAVVAVVVLVVCAMGFIVTTPQPAVGASVVDCTTVTHPASVEIICTAAGLVVLDNTIALPTVTLPPVTITVPGSTQTIRVPVPGPTITLPGTTVTLPGQPGHTTTVTAHATTTLAGPTARATATRTLAPVPGATVTAIKSPSAVGTRQPASPSATIKPVQSTRPSIRHHTVTLTRTQTIGLGLLTLVVGLLIALATLFGGYYLGYKDSEKNEARFLKSVLSKNDN